MYDQINNFYEPLVFERINEQLADEPDLAPDLLEDIACLTLNNLPPRYVRNSVDLLSHLTDEEEIELHRTVDEALIKAVDTIRRRKNSQR